MKRRGSGNDARNRMSANHFTQPHSSRGGRLYTHRFTPDGYLNVRPNPCSGRMYKPGGGGWYSRYRLQRSFDAMLRQQRILSLPKLSRLLYQASGSLQLALGDLLDVNLIGSLNRLFSIPAPIDDAARENTHISQTKSSQASPRLGQELILGHAFRPKGLNGAVDDLKGH